MIMLVVLVAVVLGFLPEAKAEGSFYVGVAVAGSGPHGGYAGHIQYRRVYNAIPVCRPGYQPVARSRFTAMSIGYTRNGYYPTTHGYRRADVVMDKIGGRYFPRYVPVTPSVNYRWNFLGLAGGQW